MPAFTAIETVNALPPVGSSTSERLSLDLKRPAIRTGKPAAEEQFQLAKDVAAFANATGGTLLVGASEDAATGWLQSYAPMPEPEARETADAYSTSVRSRCSPSPLLDPVVLPCDDGFVVAVNVWPYPGQPVGVRSALSNEAFAFPVRIGTHTVYLRPEQLPMLMLPETRRAWILLETIPAADRANVYVVDEHNPPNASELVDLDPLNNTVRFLTRNYREPFNVPLDAVGSVWQSEEGAWYIMLSGVMESEMASHGPGSTHSRPRFRGKRFRP